MNLSTMETERRLLQAALRVLQAQQAEEHAHAGTEVEYADEQLAVAAREHARAIDAQPAERWPVGWTSARAVIHDTLIRYVDTHGEITDDEDDLVSVASVIWDALGINTAVTR